MERKMNIRYKNYIFYAIFSTLFLAISLNVIAKEPSQYISICYSRFNDINNKEGGITSTVYMYTPEDKQITKIYDFEYTSQYPLGVYDSWENKVYYTKRVNGNEYVGDQIFEYDISSQTEKQLTDNLWAIKHIIPTKDKVYFLAMFHSHIFKLGSIDKETNEINYWNDDGDTSVRTINVDYLNNKIYVSTYSEVEEYENLKNQSKTNPYQYAATDVYEIDFDFNQSKKLFSLDSAYMVMMLSNNDNLKYVFDQRAFDPSVERWGDVNYISNFNLKKMKSEGFEERKGNLEGSFKGAEASYSIDGKGIYMTASVNSKRGIYYYDFTTKDYTPILLPKEEEAINNFTVIDIYE